MLHLGIQWAVGSAVQDESDRYVLTCQAVRTSKWGLSYIMSRRGTLGRGREAFVGTARLLCISKILDEVFVLFLLVLFPQLKPRKSILPHVGTRWQNGFWVSSELGHPQNYFPAEVLPRVRWARHSCGGPAGQCVYLIQPGQDGPGSLDAWLSK